MGEAKNLVEMELDKSFPNLISCDDKQGNIYLVDVEYTWICVWCENLGQKEKMFLLQPSLSSTIKSIPLETREDSLNMTVVNIDHHLKINLIPKKIFLVTRREQAISKRKWSQLQRKQLFYKKMILQVLKRYIFNILSILFHH